MGIVFLQIGHFSTLFFRVDFDFRIRFHIWASQVTKLDPSLILPRFNLCKIWQLAHVLHYDIFLYQYSSCYRCSYTPAIIGPFWSLVQLFLDSCNIFWHSTVVVRYHLQHFARFIFHIMPSPFYIQFGHTWSSSRYFHKFTFQTHAWHH